MFYLHPSPAPVFSPFYSIPNFFDDEELAYVNSIVRKEGWGQASRAMFGPTRDFIWRGGLSSQRPLSDEWVDKADPAYPLHRKIVRGFLAANEHYNYNISLLDEIAALKYTSGCEYFPHMDIDGGGSTPARKISLSVNLSHGNDYEGGKLLIHRGNKHDELPREHNTANFYPSYMIHQVTRVESGTRYVLVAWVRGEPFR